LTQLAPVAQVGDHSPAAAFASAATRAGLGLAHIGS
jgi:hypothetical protein